MKSTKLNNKRLLLEFPSRKEMTLSNFRISEFSEGKEGFKDNYFTTEKFIDGYSDENGDLDYFSYWEGFNYTKKVLLEFNELFIDKSYREELIIDISKQIDEDGYIIVMEERDKITFKHEIQHLYFSENEEYRKKCLDIISYIPTDIIDTLKEYLYDMDYIEDNVIDEMTAYITAYDKEEWEECFEELVDDETILEASKKLNEIFDEINEYKDRIN